MLKGSIKQCARALFRPLLWRYRCWPPVGLVSFGSLRRTTPISRTFGFDRGKPVDRHYIESFLQQHNRDIRGDVLELAESVYTQQFGGVAVQKAHILHVAEGHPEATLIGDLTTGEGIPHHAFDCIILTQTLPFLYDIHSAVATCHRALKPGGVLLTTFPGISQISRYDMDRWGDYWRFTNLSAQRLFGNEFGTENVTVATYGNVLVAVALLHGLATEDLRQSQLDVHDPDYQVIIGVRAVKA